MRRAKAERMGGGMGRMGEMFPAPGNGLGIHRDRTTGKLCPRTFDR